MSEHEKGVVYTKTNRKSKRVVSGGRRRRKGCGCGKNVKNKE